MHYKINFVIPKTGKYSNYSLFQGDLNKQWQLISNGQWAWIIQTFHRLNECPLSDLTITSSERALEEHINVIFVDDYLDLASKFKYYCIVIILDRYVYFPGDLNVVQNKSHKLPFFSKYIPHWSQAGLIPKNGRVFTSKNKINIGFFGLVENSANLNSALEDRYANRVKVNMAGPNNWNDYSTTDLVIAIRGFDKCTHNQKPPTKLFNAWAAGVPFIGGADSAYEQVGVDGINYLKATTEMELFKCIDLLIESPELRQKLIENGRLAFENYNNKKITSCWNGLLSNVDDYDNWKKRSLIARKINIALRAGYYNWLRIKRKILIVISRY